MMLGTTPVELGVDAAAGALVVGVVTAAAVAWRRLRRRLRALRRSPAARGALAAFDALRAPGGLRAVGPARLRVELWQSVGAATRAVRQAEEVGAAVGDLPSLTRRLHQAAEDLDRCLSMAGGLHPSSAPVAELSRQVEEVMTASASIRVAALSSAGQSASQRIGDLAADVERELRSVPAGVARARAALSRPY